MFTVPVDSIFVADIDPFPPSMSPFLITFFSTLLDDLPMFSQSRHTGEYAW
jgi:hypothetical protein